MTRSLACLMSAFIFATIVPTLARAQGGVSASLSGTAVDTAGGVIPGATVTVTNTASGTSFNTVTDARGDFMVLSLDTGTYTVTVSLVGSRPPCWRTYGCSQASRRRSSRFSRWADWKKPSSSWAGLNS